jgi:regulator of RNase E activity RraA
LTSCVHFSNEEVVKIVDLVDDALLEKLCRYSSPTISNAIETFRVRPRDVGYTDGSIRCLFPSPGPMVGFAATVRLRSTVERTGVSIFDLLAHLAEQPRPTVVVAEDVDDPPGQGTGWGEVNTSMLKAFGCLGVVTNGAVRDLPEVEAAGFQMFAASVCASHGYSQIVEVSTAVKVGGLDVSPGDLLHADLHGVVSIPLTIAHELPDVATATERKEKAIIEICQSGVKSAASLREAIAKLA